MTAVKQLLLFFIVVVTPEDERGETVVSRFTWIKHCISALCTRCMFSVSK